MKKAIVSVVLAGVIVRLAVLAGAGEALAAWVKELNVNDRLVAAALNITTERGEETEEKVMFLPDETAEPVISLIAVTPAPEAEEAQPAGEREPVPTPVAANLSTSAVLHNRTEFDIDIAALASEGLTLTLPAGEPQILIIHTHSSEAYTPDGSDQYLPSDPYRTEDKAYSVIRVGDVLTEKFESCGLTVLHDRELYDYPSYTGSYNRSGTAVAQYLEDYPSIRIVIDLHRDALGSGDVVYKTQAALPGCESAQVMLLVGTGENGLWHPNWRENLKLALYMQNAMDANYPTLARPVELVSERYNQHLTAGSMILEVGSSGNTLQEALTAIELFGDAVGPALAELVV